jgi:hypothetical protein
LVKVPYANAVKELVDDARFAVVVLLGVEHGADLVGAELLRQRRDFGETAARVWAMRFTVLRSDCGARSRCG